MILSTNSLEVYFGVGKRFEEKKIRGKENRTKRARCETAKLDVLKKKKQVMFKNRCL